MPKMITAVCLLAMVLAACGGADGDAATTSPSGAASGAEPTEPPEPTGGNEEEAPDDPGSSGLPPGGSGTVTIGGESVEAPSVYNCIIDEQFDPQPGDLDISAGLGSGIEALFLEVSNIELAMGPDPVPYIQVRASMQRRDDSGDMALYEDALYVQGPDGSWYENGDGAVGFTIARGETPEAEPLDFTPWMLDGDNATGTVMLDAGSGPVEVTYNLTLADPFDCSL